MPVVDLTDQEWNQLMTIVGDAPWKVAHPLLMRIGQQLQAQKPQAAPIINPFKPPAPRGDGADMEEHDGQ